MAKTRTTSIAIFSYPPEMEPCTTLRKVLKKSSVWVDEIMRLTGGVAQERVGQVATCGGLVRCRIEAWVITSAGRPK